MPSSAYFTGSCTNKEISSSETKSTEELNGFCKMKQTDFQSANNWFSNKIVNDTIVQR